jgi:hypothetical protein
MAESGEAGHWKVLRQMAEGSGQFLDADYARRAVPIQEWHLDGTGWFKPAGEGGDPNEAA